MGEINDLIDRLSWREDIATQKDAVRQLIRVIRDDDIGLLIQPGSDKSCWENAALVLKEVGSPRINKEIPKLLEWLADLNWPGATTVIELLATVNKAILFPYVDSAREKAASDNDDMWLDALDQLLELIDENS
jgi:hypothetical protein